MSRDTDWAALYQEDPGEGPHRRSRPPIWVIVVVVVAVVTGIWLLVNQEPKDTDPVTSPTLLPVPSEENSVGTTTTASVVTTTLALPVDGNPASVLGNTPPVLTAGTRQQLAGYVAVSSPDALPIHQPNVWMFRPGGSLVSRSDANTVRSNAEYPMLITAGRLIVGNQIFDIDLAEPPISLWTDASVYPGSGPGVVWLTRRQDSSSFSVSEWVAQVDVESLTVGEQVTDVSFYPIVGVADGLIVHDRPDDSLVFWSPTDGIDWAVDLSIGPGAAVATSGNLVVVVTSGSVKVLDVVSGGLVSSFELPFIDTSGGSVCLSPDGQHVIVVGSNGKAVVGNITTGEVIDLNEVFGFFGPTSIPPEHGIGWTADDQLVFIEADAHLKHIIGFDLATGERFVVAQLEGPEEWWLTASGTMC